MSRKLTKKQEMFCKEYLKDLNATQASIRAGYSEKTARQIATNLLSKVYIQERIQKYMDKRSEKVNITAEDVLQSILNVRDCCAKTIKRQDKETGEEYEIMVDTTWALKANELLGKHLTIFDNTKIKDEKTVAETEYIKTKTSILKGDVKDVDKLERIMKAVGGD